MKTSYKNFTKTELYIEALKGEYFQEYPEFSLEQIRRPIYLVAAGVDSDFNSYNGNELIKMCVVEAYKRILIDRENTKKKGLKYAMIRVLHFLIKKVKTIKLDVSQCGDIPFPEEDKERYLEFISKMTENVVNDMCNILEGKIAYTGKLEYWKLIGKEPQEDDDSQNRIESLVDKISGKKRPIMTIDTAESFPLNIRRRKVTFADILD